MAETINQFEDRILAEERKEEFMIAKQSYMRKGMPGPQAYHKAREEFPPLLAEVDSEEDDFEITANCPIIDSIMWAVERLEKKKVTIQDAPSSYAWTLYKNAKGNTVNTAELIRLSIVKLTPTGKQLDDAARMQDDGTDTLELIERIQNAT